MDALCFFSSLCSLRHDGRKAYATKKFVPSCRVWQSNLQVVNRIRNISGLRQDWRKTFCLKDDTSIERNDAAPSGPLFTPCAELSVPDSVECQLKALSLNDIPYKDHGLEVLFNFANLSGTFEGGQLPLYFGVPMDLYHFGHFAFKFKTRFPELVELQKFRILNVKMEESSAQVEVEVFQEKMGPSNWKFNLVKAQRMRETVWLTDSILPL